MASINGTFVLFTANPVAADPALAYLDGRIIVMPKETADRLKSQYGNFVDPNNKGHAEATKSIRHLSLLAADRQAQKQIKKLIELNTQRFFPLIKLSMTEIRVTDLLFKKSKVFLSGDLQKHYLVSKIDIIEDNYPL
jgi:cell division ATPase FtsA